jgi:hypothetical protein
LALISFSGLMLLAAAISRSLWFGLVAPAIVAIGGFVYLARRDQDAARRP